jgi:hypothetical protein
MCVVHTSNSPKRNWSPKIPLEGRLLGSHLCEPDRGERGDQGGSVGYPRIFPLQHPLGDGAQEERYQNKRRARGLT